MSSVVRFPTMILFVCTFRGSGKRHHPPLLFPKLRLLENLSSFIDLIMPRRSTYWIELERDLMMKGATRATMRCRRITVGNNPTQEELDGWELTPDVLVKLTEVDNEPVEDKEREVQELSEGMQKLCICLARKSPKTPPSVFGNVNTSPRHSSMRKRKLPFWIKWITDGTRRNT